MLSRDWNIDLELFLYTELGTIIEDGVVSDMCKQEDHKELTIKNNNMTSDYYMNN